MDSRLIHAKPGEIIPFGVYPQTADGADRTPITWRVLQNSGKELLVLSEYALDCKRYHREFVDTTWRDCDLRTWLNEQFFDAAFTAAEKGNIGITLCTDNGEGSPDTEDRVFLLGIAELRRLAEALDNTVFDKKRRAVGTQFAKASKPDGCRLFVYHGKVSSGYITANGEQQGCSWWWLRSQPRAPARAAFVGIYGSLRGYGRVNRIGYGVRPALNIKLDTN